jgi:hypothetical protein
MINPTSLGKLSRMFGFRLADAPQGLRDPDDDPGRARRAVDGVREPFVVGPPLPDQPVAAQAPAGN